MSVSEQDNNKVHLLKTAVGIASMDALRARQARFALEDPRLGLYIPHSTRNKPRRTEALLGSAIYWIIKGHIAARNTILDIVEADDEMGTKRCQFRLAPDLVPVVPVPKRAIQGWRYFEKPPADLPMAEDGAALPEDLAKNLKQMGLL